MAKTTKSGTRVGDWFLWIDAEVIKTSSYRSVPLVTLRKAVSNGDVLADVVGTRALAEELRSAANQIDTMIDQAEGAEKNNFAAE